MKKLAAVLVFMVVFASGMAFQRFRDVRALKPSPIVDGDYTWFTRSGYGQVTVKLGDVTPLVCRIKSSYYDGVSEPVSVTQCLWRKPDTSITQIGQINAGELLKR